jgi:hypothetical protein
LLRPGRLAFLFAAAVPVIGACGGRVVSLGTNGSDLQQIDPTKVSGSCNACPAGYAHPNVCCESVAGVPAQCGAYVQHPFQSCQAGWQTYPNPLTCCSLKDDKDCIDTPTTEPAPSPPPYGCGYACPPGWYTPAGAPKSPNEGECCQVKEDGSTVCMGWGSAAPGYAGGKDVPVATSCGGTGTGTPPPSPPIYVDGGKAIDAGPAPWPDGGKPAPDAGDVDGGDVDAGCPDTDAGPEPPPGYDGGPWSLCGECPDGWKPDPTKPDLCCRWEANGIEECFSQATGPIGSGGGGTPTPVDAGVPEPQPTPGPFGCSGSSPDPNTKAQSCSCEGADASGHKDALDCTVDANGNATCFCTQDGNATQQFSVDVGICGESQVLQKYYLTCFPG